jgi:hypothetical protein
LPDFPNHTGLIPSSPSWSLCKAPIENPRHRQC